MISLSLPIEDRRTYLRSFWIVICLFLGVVLSVLGWLLQVRFFLAIAGGVAAISASLVFVRQEFVQRLYHAWNRRIVSPFAKLAKHNVMSICYFVIFVATRMVGSRWQYQAAADWKQRTSLPAEAYELPYRAAGRNRTGWISNYIAWAFRTDNFWSIALIPFLLILRLLKDEEKKTFEANIYTLF